MNVTMKMTLDGLVRALRWRGHELADDAERGYRQTVRPPAVEEPPLVLDRAARMVRERRDDRPGR